MKNLRNWILIGSLAIGIASCGKDEPIVPEPVKPVPVDTTKTNPKPTDTTKNPTDTTVNMKYRYEVTVVTESAKTELFSCIFKNSNSSTKSNSYNINYKLLSASNYINDSTKISGNLKDGESLVVDIRLIDYAYQWYNPEAKKIIVKWEGETLFDNTKEFKVSKEKRVISASFVLTGMKHDPNGAWNRDIMIFYKERTSDTPFPTWRTDDNNKYWTPVNRGADYIKF